MPLLPDPTLSGSNHKTDIQLFVEEHGYKLSSFFGLCASTSTTSMVTQEILVNYLTMPWGMQPQIVILIAIAITYNLLMDLIFYCIEKYWLNKIDIYLSLKEKEAIKFFLLAIAAAILISQAYYVLPIGLLLFSASYFINFGLQLKLAETINKLFFTQDEAGVVKWLEGYKKCQAGIILGKWQLRTINFGCLLSTFYVIAVIGVFAKWVFPLILALASLKIVIPLMVTACIILLAYGVIYGFLSANSWATLVQENAKFKAQHHGYGLLSLTGLAVLAGKIQEGCSAYAHVIKESIVYCFYNFLALLFVPDKKIKLQALFTIIGFIILAAAELIFLSIKLFQFLIVILIFPAFTAVQSILESGGTTVGNGVDSNGLGLAITYGAFIGYLPFIVQSCVNTILPETKKTENYQPDFWSSLYNIWLKCFQSANALANSGLSNDGQLPDNNGDFVKMSGNGAVSYTAGGMAINNINDKNQEQQNQATYSSLTQYLWGSKKEDTVKKCDNSQLHANKIRMLY